jgi:hypothetical protein
MAAVPNNLKFMLLGMGPKFHATVAFILEILGLASLVLGIIAAFKNEPIGIWSTEWFLIAIALWIWALWSWLVAYVAAKE